MCLAIICSTPALFRFRAGIAGLAVALAACGDAAAGPDAGIVDAGDGGADATVAMISGLTAVPNPANALSYFVDWRTDVAAPTHLEVACADPLGDDYEVTIVDPRVLTEHQVFVMGLFPAAECTFEAVAEPDDGIAARAELSVTVAAAPDFLPAARLRHRDVEEMEPGWTLLNLGSQSVRDPMVVAMVDELGRYRWYHRTSDGHWGGDNDVRTVSEGVLVGGLWSLIRPFIVDWEGNVVWRGGSITMHHHIETEDDGATFLYLGHTNDCPQGVPANTVDVWDRALGERVWQWKICDHYDPPVATNDWDHLNTIEPFPGEDAMLISSRNLDQLLKVDRTTGEVVWALGADGDFALDAAGQFLHQHDPEITEDGTIVLFDNGLSGTREWSRAIEIAYDEQAMTAEVVWEFRPDPDIFAPIWGDADRLPGGTTLVTFGRRAATEDTHLIEVAADGSEVWHLSFDLGWGTYRAERVTDPPRGHVVTSD